jgi:hypothetical protein
MECNDAQDVKILQAASNQSAGDIYVFAADMHDRKVFHFPCWAMREVMVWVISPLARLRRPGISKTIGLAAAFRDSEKSGEARFVKQKTKTENERL